MSSISARRNPLPRALSPGGPSAHDASATSRVGNGNTGRDARLLAWPASSWHVHCSNKDESSLEMTNGEQ
jgi:hypothetical protein